MRITVTISGDKKLINKLERLDDKIKNLAVEFAEIGEFEKKWFSSFPFVSQGGIYGSTWPRLDKGYQVSKARRYPGSPMLVRTGQMKNSFGFHPTKDYVRIFNDTPYFKYHQLGTRNMPKRVIMQIEDTQKRAIIDIIEKAIKRKIEAV